MPENLHKRLLSMFNNLCVVYGVHRVRVAGGPPCFLASSVRLLGNHQGPISMDPKSYDDGSGTQRLLALAKDLLSSCRKMLLLQGGEPLAIRIGMATGTCDYSQDRDEKSTVLATITTALRMERTCTPGSIQLSPAAYAVTVMAGRRSEAGQWEAGAGGAATGSGYLWRLPAPRPRMMPGSPSSTLKLPSAFAPMRQSPSGMAAGFHAVPHLLSTLGREGSRSGMGAGAGVGAVSQSAPSNVTALLTTRWSLGARCSANASDLQGVAEGGEYFDDDGESIEDGGAGASPQLRKPSLCPWASAAPANSPRAAAKAAADLKTESGAAAAWSGKAAPVVAGPKAAPVVACSNAVPVVASSTAATAAAGGAQREDLDQLSDDFAVLKAAALVRGSHGGACRPSQARPRLRPAYGCGYGYGYPRATEPRRSPVVPTQRLTGPGSLSACRPPRPEDGLQALRQGSGPTAAAAAAEGLAQLYAQQPPRYAPKQGLDALLGPHDDELGVGSCPIAFMSTSGLVQASSGAVPAGADAKSSPVNSMELQAALLAAFSQAGGKGVPKVLKQPCEYLVD